MSLKVVNLSKRINDTWVLRDVSFEIAGGEVFGIFGRSGSGKTILADLISGATAPGSGSVSLDESNAGTAGGERGGIVTNRGKTPSFWQRLVNRPAEGPTSKDQLERVLSALEAPAQVVVLDDPFCGMDDLARATCMETIRAVASVRGRSVLIAANEFDDILGICDRAAVLVRGEIRQVGTPREIYEKPESRAVAACVGRYNLFAARRLTSSKAEIPEFHTIDGGHRLFAQRIDRGALGALNQNVTLGIRPEYVSISFGASFPEDNLLKATVEKVTFLGPTTLIELDADGLQIDALVLRLVGLNEGDECMVGLPPDRISIFKD